MDRFRVLRAAPRAGCSKRIQSGERFGHITGRISGEGVRLTTNLWETFPRFAGGASGRAQLPNNLRVFYPRLGEGLGVWGRDASGGDIFENSKWETVFEGEVCCGVEISGGSI